MSYWLFKSEPSTYSIDDLCAEKNKKDHWDGIRNYTVRNMIRDQIKKEDLGFFYHSSCATPGIVGIVKVTKESYPDHTAFDPSSKYFDEKSDIDSPRWFMFDVQFVKKFSQIISLESLRSQAILSDMQLLKRGNRLSITPVSTTHWNHIISLTT
ncbi:MAG: EVE domain-containing protein [Legionellales bacterium]|nr:EVE domain-containing protein [Legionellales bacterium]